MAHTRIFKALRRALGLAYEARRRGVEPKELAEQTYAQWRFDRRRFLQGAAGAAAVASLPIVGAGCADDGGDAGTTEGVRIAIVGGGMAGLHCAYVLKKAGVTARVFEASERAGGRMYSVRGKFAEGMVAELGGELIDTPHETIRNLATELGVQLDDLYLNEPAGYVRDTFFVGGKALSESELVTLFTPIAEKMAATVALAEDGTPAGDAEFERIDNMNIVEWLDQEAKADPVMRALLKEAFVGEYGLEAEEQSAFNLLYLIDYENPDPFHIFGDSDERFHTHLGNDTITTKLAEALPGQIELGMKLVAAADTGTNQYTLTFDKAGSTVEETFDHVVFALPFTLLRTVDTTKLAMPDEKRQLIADIGYGTNAKLMTGYTSRVWHVKHNASGSAITDNGVQFVWDTSRGQAGTSGILTNFAGGKYGVKMGDGTPEERAKEFLPFVDQIFPGTKEAYIADSAVRFHWPTHKHTLGSYACYKPGQWATWGMEAERVGNLHFCGEHTSLDFQGFMEGACETGAKAAAELLADLGVSAAKRSGALKVLGRKLALPQPRFFGRRRQRLTWMQRRRIVLAETGHRRF